MNKDYEFKVGDVGVLRRGDLTYRVLNVVSEVDRTPLVVLVSSENRAPYITTREINGKFIGDGQWDMLPPKKKLYVVTYATTDVTIHNGRRTTMYRYEWDKEESRRKFLADVVNPDAYVLSEEEVEQ